MGAKTRFGVVAGALLGCRATPTSGDVGAAATAATAAVVADAGAAVPRQGCAPPNPSAKRSTYEPCLTKEDFERFARELHAALRAGDWERVASFVRFPLRLDAPFCPKEITTAKELVARYEQVFTRALVDDILAEQPPYFVRDEHFLVGRQGAVWAWVQGDGRLLISVVNATHDVPGLPCVDRVPEPLPDDLWGTWTLRSAAPPVMFPTPSFPWADFSRFSIDLDRAASTLTVRWGDEKRVCRVQSYARRREAGARGRADEVALGPCPALREAIEPTARVSVHVLEADCSEAPALAHGEEIEAPPVYLTSDGAMIVGLQSAKCEGFAVLRRRDEKAPRRPPHLAPRGAACGGEDVRCTAGTICLVVSRDPWVERCEPPRPALQ